MQFLYSAPLGVEFFGVKSEGYRYCYRVIAGYIIVLKLLMEWLEWHIKALVLSTSMTLLKCMT